MKTKEKDIEYCGVDRGKISKSHPELNEEVFGFLYKYIIDRYKVHIRKDVKKDLPPWTHNSVIADHRFTNVRRELDKQTKWMLEHITNNPDLTLRAKIENTILFRLFSSYETMELLGLPNKNIQDWESFVESCREKVESKKAEEPKFKFFTSAFMTSGMKGTWMKRTGERDSVMAILKSAVYIHENRIAAKVQHAKNQQYCYDIIRSLPGFGDFMAYQIFVDLTYIQRFPFSENEFTIAGIGAKKGLNYLFRDYDGLNYEEAIFWLRDNINQQAKELLGVDLEFELVKLMKDIPRHDRYMNVMSLENCMCELGKYCDIIYKKGRNRPKYRGGK